MAGKIFFDTGGRVRSGWRAAMFVVLCGLLSVFLNAVVFGTIYSVAGTGALSQPAFILINGSVMLISGVLAGYVSLKLFERLPFASLGVGFFPHWLKHLGLGCLLGAGALSAAVLVAVVFGGLRLSFNSESGAWAIVHTMSLSLLIFMVAAAFEEVVFRGYLLQTWDRSGLRLFGVLLTSILFAAVHNQNPSVNYISWINTFLAGVWFAAAYWKTKSLWLPWAMHFMWNWMQGAFYGIEVSGLTELASAPMMRETDLGPAWLTGGDYGLEGGVACTAALLLAMGVVHLLPESPDTEPAEDLISSGS